MPIVAALCVSVAFSAQPTPRESPKPAGKKSHDLGSLIDLGLSANPATRAAWFQARAAAAAVGEARAPYFPRISAGFEGGADQWYTPAANAPDNFRRRQATTVLSLEFLLLDFGRRAADVRRTLAALDAAGLAYERGLQRVVFDVQRRYFAHEAALRGLESADALVAAARAVAETVNREADAGLAATPDRLAAEKNLLEAGFARESASALVRTSLGDLCVAAGLPANTPLVLAKSDLPASTASLRGQANKLIEAALAERPDLAARAADVRARTAATERARADFLPEIRIEGKYAYSAFGYDARAGKTHGSYAEDLNGYGAFLVAKWDLFDGFERVAREKKRAAEERAAREDLAQARLDATRDVWTAYHDTLSAASRVDFAEGFVKSARENFASTRTAYSSGLATVAEFSDSAARLANAESTRATALADYSTCLAALAFSTGQPAVAGAAGSHHDAKNRQPQMPLGNSRAQMQPPQ
jgi:outer membrane protein TolC